MHLDPASWGITSEAIVKYFAILGPISMPLWFSAQISTVRRTRTAAEKAAAALSEAQEREWEAMRDAVREIGEAEEARLYFAERYPEFSAAMDRLDLAKGVEREAALAKVGREIMEAGVATEALKHAEKALIAATAANETARLAAEAASELNTRSLVRATVRIIAMTGLLVFLSGLVGKRFLNLMGFELAFVQLLAARLFWKFGNQQIEDSSVGSNIPWENVIRSLIFPGLFGTGIFSVELGYQSQFIREHRSSLLVYSAPAIALGMMLGMMLLAPAIANLLDRRPHLVGVANTISGYINMTYAIAFAVSALTAIAPQIVKAVVESGVLTG